MSGPLTIVVVSDIHYASTAEQARGDDFELRSVANPALRLLLRTYRHFIWLRHPLRQNHLIETFLGRVGHADWVVANGDYSCDSAFVGLSDDAACDSARECLTRLRERFGVRLRANLGDHELGKFGLSGVQGGMRLASYYRACDELALQPFWRVEAGRYVLIGIASSLVAWPVFELEALPSERQEWERLHQAHLAEICSAFDALQSDQRVLLFCHDPTALPFLWRQEAVRRKLSQLDHTIIGHLHSELILAQSKLLSGMPSVRFLGPSVRRMSAALREGRHWKAFRVRLCPSLAGIELLKDGGFLTIHLPEGPEESLRLQTHRLGRR